MRLIGLLFQGKGIGSLFLKNIEELLSNEGVDGMMLNNEREFPSCSFYKKNRFKILGDLVVMGK